ncbi:hypothetical protein P7C73_g542, partial [Tremellales sp. Uapishka_1]
MQDDTRLPSSTLNSFATLPHEILEQIYLVLGLHDRLRLLQTCSALRDAYIGSTQLAYDFALRTSSYLDVPYLLPSNGSSASTNIRNKRPAPSSEENALSTAEKTVELRDREARWATLQAKHTETLKVQGPAGVYELQEGIFLMCDEYSDQDDGRPTSIRLIPLPSARDVPSEYPDKASTSRSHKLKFSIADLTMDPTQDLIVVSEHNPAASVDSRFTPTHRYHLLSLSTFKPHPLATLPTLDFPSSTQVVFQTRQLLQVMGDTLVVLVSRYAAHWLLAGMGLINAGLGGGMGGNEEEIRMALPSNVWFGSIALLTPTSFMVTTTSSTSPVLNNEPREIASVFPPVIHICSFAPDVNHPVNPVQPLEADHMDDTTPRPILLAQLELPLFQEGTIVSSFDVRPDPAFPPSKTSKNQKGFTQDPGKGVLVFDIQVMEPAAQDDGNAMLSLTYELFVLRETLVAMVKEGERHLRDSRSREGILRIERVLKWQDWGEANARMMDVSMRRRNWVCSCSGYRFVSLRRSDLSADEDDEGDDEELHELMPTPPRKCDVQVYDFAPYLLRKQVSRGVEEEDQALEIRVVTEPTILPRRDIWKEDVASRLPFREVTRKLGVRANGVMIDDQRIILVCTKGRRAGDLSKIKQEMTVLCM